MSSPILRRDAIWAGIAAISAPWATFAGDRASSVLSFRLVEPAGLVRVAEPVSTVVPTLEHGIPTRLVRDGRAVPAQFRTVVDTEGKPSLRLDFAVNLGPAATVRYEVHHRAGILAGPEPEGGLILDRVDNLFTIRRNHVESFAVAPSLANFLRSAGSPQLRYVTEGSPGLSLTLRSGETLRPGPGGGDVVSTIVREGPLAVALRFVWTVAPGVRSVVELSFPASREQIRTDWSLKDPDDQVALIGLDLNLIRDTVRRRIDAGPGWTRVADAQHQVVATIADFDGSTSLDVSPEGRLSLGRRFADASRAKTLAFCLAFAPARIAADQSPSPLALLAPIRVEWDQPAPSRG